MRLEITDVKVTRGHITKQGSRMLRWAVIEAIQKNGPGTPAGSAREAIIARRGKEARSIAKVAAARRLLTLACYGLRGGEIRCLAQTPDNPPPATSVLAA